MTEDPRASGSGASSAPVPSTRSKTIMLRFRSRSSRSIARAIQPHRIRKLKFETLEGKAAGGAKSAAVTRTATKTPTARKSLSDYITERFDDFSRSQKDVARYIVDHLDEAAFQTAEELARRANTSSSTVVRFSQALGFEGYPELQQSAIEEYRHKVAEGAGQRQRRRRRRPVQLRPLRVRGSLGADYSNIEETAAQPDPRAGRGLGLGARDLAPRADRRRRPDGLLRQLPAPPARPARRPGRDRRLAEPGQHPEAFPHGRGHAARRAHRRPRAPAGAAGPEARPATAAPGRCRSPTRRSPTSPSTPS